MDLDPNECVDSSLYFYPHLYDREELAFLIARLRAGGVFLDVGAHIGWYSLAIAKEVPAVRVIAVEADPFNGKRLREHVALNSMENRVTIVPCGVSDKDEVLSLNLQLRGNRGGNSFVFEHQASVDVRCLPLAAILSDLQIDEIAAMKLDIEGFEFRVLNRFLNDVPRSVWPRSVVIEYFAEQANTGDTIRLLTSHGYRVVRRTRMNWLLELPGTEEQR